MHHDWPDIVGFSSFATVQKQSAGVNDKEGEPIKWPESYGTDEVHACSW